MTPSTLPGLEPTSERVDFVPTREAGLQRLERFTARTARHYAGNRNFDLGSAYRSNVSALSPWIRHRLVTEEEVLTAVLARYSLRNAEKFVQEVFWRTYFKGWLEQRPSVWAQYQMRLLKLLKMIESDASLRASYSDAVDGNTGIDCFDHWAHELIATGYLHNHSRMWFASIWIFTLRLPWELGADFFLRHLLDGDPASNTLSWRWVAGLHTKGKTYLARADNIAKYTEGRFCPSGLASSAEPLTETTDHPRVPIRRSDPPPDAPYLLLLTEEDMCGTALCLQLPEHVTGLLATHGRSPQSIGLGAARFAKEGLRSALPSNAAEPLQYEDDWAGPLLAAAAEAGVRTVVTAFPPIGPTRTRLDRAEPRLHAEGVELVRARRFYDTESWPHAKAGFFGLKKKIPEILSSVGLMD